MPRTLLLGWWVCGVGALFYSYEYLLRITPSIISTELRETFQLDATTFGAFAGLYYLASAPMQLVSGILMDRYGPRRLLILALLICATGIYFLYPLGRFIGGIGAAFAFVGALKLATIWLPPRLFGVISGLITSFGMLGAIGGNVLVVFWVKSWGWQPTLTALAVLGIIISALILFSMPEKKSDNNPEGGLGELFSRLAIFIKSRYIWINGFICGMLSLSLSVFAELWGPLYLRKAYLYTPTEASHGIAMVFLGWAIGSPLFGWLSEHLNCRRLPLFISNIILTLLICLIFYLPISIPKVGILSLLFLFGLFSGAQVITFMVAKELAPTARLAGTAIALTNTIALSFGALLQPFVGKLLDWRWQGAIENQMRVYSATEYHHALLIIPAGTLLAAIFVYCLKETAPIRCKTSTIRGKQ